MSYRLKLPSIKLSARAAKRGFPMQTENEESSKVRGSSKHLKWAIAVSLIVNLILLIWLLFTPSKADSPPDLSKYTQQDIQKAVKVAAGMPKQAVATLLGDPAVKEFSGSSEEWHYCKTGDSVDEYVAILFQDNSVTSLQYYTFNSLDIALHYGEQLKANVYGRGGWGDCRLGVRWGTYNQKTPDMPESRVVQARSTSPAASRPTGK
jgi:outer membrane protein assembly factor BamE (lipoprotein component of BamABCDE complex)